MEIKSYEIEPLISQTNYCLGEIGFTTNLKTTEWAIFPLRNDFHNVLQDSIIIINTQNSWHSYQTRFLKVILNTAPANGPELSSSRLPL